MLYYKIHKDLFLFDVDGTLTLPRQRIKSDMLKEIQQLSSYNDVGIVSGSDLNKVEEQIGSDNLKIFKWVFSENGLNSFKDGLPFHSKSITDYLGEDN